MKIKIIPTGGLCNRLRAIATTIAIAKHYNCSLSIYWNNCIGLKANFADLFEPIHIEKVHLIENTQWLYHINGTKDYLLRKWFLRLGNEQVVFNHSIYTQGDIYQKLKSHYKGNLLLISCYPMCTDYQIQNIFVPKRDLQLRIDQITSSFSKNMIGVHIRRTDNIASIKSSPIDVFVHLMQLEIEKEDTVKFYVASDEEEVKKELQDKFPGRVITLMDDTSRDSLEGMKFAVVDLFCLSKTKKILGSVASSYSQIAAEIGGIKIEYAKCNEN